MLLRLLNTIFRAFIVALVVTAASYAVGEMLGADTEWAAYCAEEGKSDPECIEYKNGEDSEIEDLRAAIDLAFLVPQFAIAFFCGLLVGVWGMFSPLSRNANNAFKPLAMLARTFTTPHLLGYGFAIVTRAGAPC